MSRRFWRAPCSPARFSGSHGGGSAARLAAGRALNEIGAVDRVRAGHTGRALGRLALRARLAVGGELESQYVHADRPGCRGGLELPASSRCCFGDFPPNMLHEGGTVPVYFEAAAVITALVLLGQVLELRARSRTNAAIKAVGLAPKTARIVRQDGSEDIRWSRWCRRHSAHTPG